MEVMDEVGKGASSSYTERERGRAGTVCKELRLRKMKKMNE
jgi:hypothetical protein